MVREQATQRRVQFVPSKYPLAKPSQNYGLSKHEEPHALRIETGRADPGTK